jgi:ATP-dependent exoDNAse (exonuclease V) alpha subunit
MRLLSNIDFTQGQKDVINMFLDGVENGFKDKRTYVIQGKPGVGKSFTMSILIKIFELIGYYVKCGTFTGKASQVLRDKGVDSNTLHSLMYKPNIDENGKIISWSKNDNIECDVLYIDEFSMISKDLIEDIIGYNKITIFFGDKNQLMPIGEESMYLENCIDKELNEIVRQERDNPIIKVLNDILEGVELQKNMKLKTEQGLFATLDLNLNASTIEKLKYEYDIMICGTNKFRHMLNHQYRKHKGYKEYLCEGERIMILKNDKDNGIFNGQVLTVKNIIGKPEMDEAGFTVVDINTDDGIYKISINGLLNPEFDFDDYLFKNKVHKLKEYTKPAFVNYAYAITVHRSQGSEYTKVLVFSQDMKWMLYKQETKEKGQEMYKRALFTAISRTKNKCVVVM